MVSRLAVVAAVVMAVGAVSSPCAATEEGDVMMANFLLLRIRCPAADYSVAERAAAVQARANDLLILGGFDLDTIQVKKVGGDVGVFANGRLLVTVDRCDAQANNTTPEGLARVWANRLRDIYPKVVPISPTEEPAAAE